MMDEISSNNQGPQTTRSRSHPAAMLRRLIRGQSRTFSVLFVLSACLTLSASPVTARQYAMKCEINAEYTRANCSSRNLQHVPYGLFTRIRTLDLSGNNFRDQLLPNRSFLSYIYLEKLYLRNNSLRELQESSLESMIYLKVLDLSNNLLTGVPSTALSHVANSLEKLLLAGNKIYQLPARTFIELRQLQHLDLSGNSIHLVRHQAFSGLTSLRILKLRHNALKTLPVDAFKDFPDNMDQVQLYENRWFCDCQLRWLRLWMNRTDPAVWNSTGYHVRCDGPSVVRDTSLDSRSLDELACEVQMKTSGVTREVGEGEDVMIQCKYSSVPKAEAKWLRNSEIINVKPVPFRYAESVSEPAAIAVVPNDSHDGKFRIRTSTETSALDKELKYISQLLIRDFRYEDIARYKCFVQNIRGGASAEFRMTLRGVAFDSVTVSQPSGRVAETGGGMDTRSIVIAVAVVCGIVLIVAIGVLILCSVSRVQRRRREKREAIEETVKQHFIENSELMTNGEASSLHDPNKSLTDRLDGRQDDQRSFSNNTNDSAVTAVKRPFDLSAEKDEVEPPYIFQQPGSPFNNGNTYVSFGSELTDPGDFTMVPMGTLGRGGQHPAQPQNPRHMAGSRGYESSHAGSGTPLLDRGTPSILDSDEPIEDYAQYPVYDSLTNTLQRPNGETSSIYGGSLQHPLSRNEAIYGGSLRHGEGIYGGSLHQYPLRPQNNGEPIYGGSMRNGAMGSPLAHGRDPDEPYADPNLTKRLSSFQYPPAPTFPLPRTPTNARPSSTLPAPVPRYADHRTVPADRHSPRVDQYGPVPHNYRDYREMHYASTTPPSHRMNAGKKSMSVGNLGHPHSAPRKPPRLFQSREYLELTPTDRDLPATTPTYTPGGADYITSPEAQIYGQSYGITPGTPV